MNNLCELISRFLIFKYQNMYHKAERMVSFVHNWHKLGA